MPVECKNIDPELYRHPGERAARAKLEKIPGFAKCVAMLADSFNASAERQAELGSAARVGPGVYPALHSLWAAVQARFGLGGIPLHIVHRAGGPAALRGGNARPAVLLDAALLPSLPEREMEALLAAQAGAIRLGNATLDAAADTLRAFLGAYGVAGAPAVLPAWGLENWRLCALFSADRAAALALGSPEAVYAWLDRLAGAGESAWGGVTRPDDLRVQGLEAASRQRDPGPTWPGGGMLRRLALAMNRGNNAGIVRRTDLTDWFAGGAPARMLSGELTDPEQEEAKPGADPSIAYWGEFAGWDGEADGWDGEADGGDGSGGAAGMAAQAFGDLKDSAEKGLGALFRAGEAFWTTLTESGGGK